MTAASQMRNTSLTPLRQQSPALAEALEGSSSQPEIRLGDEPVQPDEAALAFGGLQLLGGHLVGAEALLVLEDVVQVLVLKLAEQLAVEPGVAQLAQVVADLKIDQVRQPVVAE